MNNGVGVFKDCMVIHQYNILTIENDGIRQKIDLSGGFPVSLFVENKKSGYRFENWERKTAMFHLSGFDFTDCTVIVGCETHDHFGLSEACLAVSVLYTGQEKTVKQVFEIYPGSPFIVSTLYAKGSFLTVAEKAEEKATGIEKKAEAIAGILPHEDTVEAIGLGCKHLKLETVSLFDNTDTNNTLVKTGEEMLYTGRVQSFDGNLFVIKDYIGGEALLLAKDGILNPGQFSLRVKGTEFAEIAGSGLDGLCTDEFVPCYGVTIGVAPAEEIKRAYKKHYGKVYRGDRSGALFVMSNTWGDRNQDKAVCEAFIKKEIETAHFLGVDIVQIDDGWQKGTTSNSALKQGVWEGYYDFDPLFWNVNKEKFPNGLEPIVAFANENHVKLGLWFSPDSSQDFCNWQKDAEVLLGLFRQYGVGYFKLDGIKIRNKCCEANLIKMMETVTQKSGGLVSFNLDITAERRFGYLYQKQFGTLFVENRYTDWGSYYPAWTMKNLWQLAEVLPAKKLLFEVLNLRRNKHVYTDDPLAPNGYDADYAFAGVMVANPLLWMEMSSLEEKDKDRLSEIIKVYKQHSKILLAAEILPLGRMPDGTEFTGFQAIVKDGEGYLLLFREYTGMNSYDFILHDLFACRLSIKILAQNGDAVIADCVSDEGRIHVEFSNQNNYVFVKYLIC